MSRSAKTDIRWFCLRSFAVVALLLAAVGIYGLMAFAVAQRTQEIGLRLALGATQAACDLADAERSVAAGGDWARDWAGGCGAGGPDHAFSTLYGVGAMDFSVIVSVGVILFVTALFASYLPARRAARIDPMRALRMD